MHLLSIPSDVLINILTFISWYDIYVIIRNKDVQLKIKQMLIYQKIVNNIFIVKKELVKNTKKEKQNKIDIDNIIKYAAAEGCIELIKVAKQNGYILDKEIYIIAAANGQIEFLKYIKNDALCNFSLYEYPWWNKYTCTSAAGNGNLKCLQYAYESGFSWDEETCAVAGENGKLECLQYAHENGCPWDKRTCEIAAKNGHFECLKYAHENGCPWDKTTCDIAAINGHLKCLQYAHENGCPWDTATYWNAERNNHLDCSRYIYNNNIDCLQFVFR